MSRFITQGFEVLDDYGNVAKDYFIKDRETGLEILAEKQTNGSFSAKIGERVVTGTIKAIKEVFGETIDETGPKGELVLGRGPEDVDEGGRGTWDSCHPCAIITELLGVCDRLLDGPDGQRLQRVINNTLDCWGWADKEGNPDYDASRREIDLWMSNEHDAKGQDSA